MSENKMKQNTGGLFENRLFGRKPNAPKLLGRCIIDGKRYRISGWNNMTATGEPFIGLKFISEEDFQRLRQEHKRKKEKRQSQPEYNTNKIYNSPMDCGESDFNY